MPYIFVFQCYGSSNKKLMGVYLQKSVLIFFLTSLLPLTLYINAELILVGVGLNEHVA